MKLGYTMAPFGLPGTQPTYSLQADYEDVDLKTFTDYLETQGLRLAGRASGRTVLDWPRGRFADRVGEGQLVVTAPGGVAVMTAERSLAAAAAGRPQPAPGGALQQPHPARTGAGHR